MLPGIPHLVMFLILAEPQFSVLILTFLKEESVLCGCAGPHHSSVAGTKNSGSDLGMPACPFYQLIRFPPSVGFSINKFQPTLTMVKYLPTWHLVGDSQSLGMLQTAPLQASEGREETRAWGAPFPWRSVFSPQHPRLACALECPPGEGSHVSIFWSPDGY